jgi:formylglycine-generating enzyme required for sulfatase activity
MKKTLLVLTFTLLTALTFAQERISIAVFPFEVMDNVLTRNESILFYRRFSNEFVNMNNGSYRVVPRQDVEKLINTEAAFQLSDFSARAKTAEMERVLNGTQILFGYIGKLQNKITVSISLYTYPDLEQLRGGIDLDVANSGELFEKVPELVRSMQNKISSGGARQPSQSSTQTQQTATATYPANMVRIEGGTFTMGNASGGNSDERPVHTVTVKTF